MLFEPIFLTLYTLKPPWYKLVNKSCFINVSARLDPIEGYRGEEGPPPKLLSSRGFRGFRGSRPPLHMSPSLEIGCKIPQKTSRPSSCVSYRFGPPSSRRAQTDRHGRPHFQSRSRTQAPPPLFPLHDIACCPPLGKGETIHFPWRCDRKDKNFTWETFRIQSL